MIDSPFGFQSDLPFLNQDSTPLTYQALFHHTTKYEPLPSPPLPLFRDSSLSPVPSSVTSVTSDELTVRQEPLVKRPRTHSPSIPSTKGVRLIRSISPNVQRKSTPQSIQVQPRRYRAILPAPPKRELLPNQPTPQPQAAAASTSQHAGQIQPPKQKVDRRPPFEHSPTNLPPRRYAKGQDTPFRPERLQGTIPGSMLDTV